MARDFIQMDLLSWGLPDPKLVFSRDELKLLDVGFNLVRYQRDRKQLEHADATCISGGWTPSEVFPTFAAAERALKKLKEQGCIEVNLKGYVIMTGWNQPGGLLAAGFEFYRVYGLRSFEVDSGPWCIKVGSKNWSNLAKYPGPVELQAAWDELMKQSTALEG